MRIGIVCYPTFGGSGVLATELGKALADQQCLQHQVQSNCAVANVDRVVNVL